MCNGKKAAAGPYKILATYGDAHDDVIKGLDTCQEALAEHHTKLYQDIHASLTRAKWHSLLSCGRLREHIKQGVAILHAVDVASGEVLGYLSYKRYDEHYGATSDPSRPSGRIKLNHIVVLAAHRGRGIGRALFSHIFERYSSPEERNRTYDYSIVACEFNIDAIAWYRRLGFAVVGMHVSHKPTYPVCYVHMHRTGDQAPVKHMQTRRIFGSEVIGEKLEQVAVNPSKLLKVTEYDDATGLHKLESGTTVDLTAAFASGAVQFERPLHDVLGLADNIIIDTNPSSEPSVAATCLRQRKRRAAVPTRSPRAQRQSARFSNNTITGNQTSTVPPARALRSQKPERKSSSSKKEDTVEAWESSVCKVCNDGKDDGAILLCDGLSGQCNATYHYYCVGLCEIPSGDWFCPSCTELKKREAMPEQPRSQSQKRGRSPDTFEPEGEPPSQMEDLDLSIEKGCALGCGSSEDNLEHYLVCETFRTMVEQSPHVGLEGKISSEKRPPDRIDFAIAGYAVAHAVRDCNRLGGVLALDSDDLLRTHLRNANEDAKRLRLSEGDTKSDSSTTAASYRADIRGRDLARILLSPFLQTCTS